ncbi:MAG: hypothetical protein J5685_04730 [Clostridiales bacterium]|nr:hypothetical protein [Clostridiales bacterium]
MENEYKQYEVKPAEFNFRTANVEEAGMISTFIKGEKLIIIPIVLMMVLTGVFVYTFVKRFMSTGADNPVFIWFPIAVFVIMLLGMVPPIIKKLGLFRKTDDEVYVADVTVVGVKVVRRKNHHVTYVDLWSETDHKYTCKIRYIGIGVHEGDRVLLAQLAGGIDHVAFSRDGFDHAVLSRYGRGIM